MSNLRKTLDAEKSALVTNPGEVVAEIEAIEDYVSKTDGACLKVSMSALSGDEEGKHIVAILSKAPQAAFRIRQLVEACGKNPDAINDSDELIGCQVRVRLVEDHYKGERRLKVGSFARAV